MPNSENLSSIDCVNILVNQTLLKALSKQCHLYEKLLKEARAEMKKLNDEQPDGYKFEQSS